MISVLIAVTILEMSRNGIDLRVDADRTQIDPGRSVFLMVTMRTPKGVKASFPDLRDRVVGFSLAEDYAEEPETAKDGSQVQAANWRLVPEPCADVYKIRPFAVGDVVAGPVYFEPPPAREPVTGGMECDPKKDLLSLFMSFFEGKFSTLLPPFLVVFAAVALLFAAAGLVFGLWLLVKYIWRRVHEHFMSPIERAWAELDRLLKKDLPGYGLYKDFYIELTMVVRRYVQRKYGISAPHLTTEEFLAQFRGEGRGRSDELAKFLESADMVKFAGVKATPEMAYAATRSARSYLESDSAEEVAK